MTSVRRIGSADRLAAMAFAWLLCAPANSAAVISPAVSDNVPVPGGLATLARALDIPVPDHARCLSEVARVIYGDSPARRAQPDSAYRRWLAYVAAASAPGTMTPDLIPVPLDAAIWSRAVFGRPVTRERLLTAILSDANAALLGHGLAALDDETLQFFGEHPALLKLLYTRHAKVFASFAGHLRIRRGRVVPPSGMAAVPLWEAVLDKRVSDPVGFVTALFGNAKGRFAYLYELVGQLDGPRAAFVLGLWLPNTTERLTRFRALAQVAVSAMGEWDATRVPFTRPASDLSTLFQRVQVNASGVPRPPNTRGFWAAVYSGEGDQRDRTKDDDRTIDAAWLAERIVTRHGPARSMRLDQFGFGHRAFESASREAMLDVLDAVRAFSEMPMLMLAAERIGVRAPAVYVALFEHARRITRLDRARRYGALAQFQGAIVLIDRMVRVRSLDSQVAEHWLAHLAAVPIDASQGYNGNLVAWLSRRVRSAIAGTADDPPLDDVLIAVLAGPPQPSSRPIRWEGQTYTFDLTAGEAARIRSFHRPSTDSPLDMAVDAVDVATALRDGRIPAEMADAALERLNALLRRPGDAKSRAQLTRPPRTSELTARALLQAVDAVAADALLSLAYAIHWNEPDGHRRSDRGLPRRHDFGIDSASTPVRARGAWLAARLDFKPGIPWHVTGSLFGLDIALAPLSLRRTAARPPRHEPRMLSTDRHAFASSLGLMDVFALRDSDAEAIAAAIIRGQQRVSQLTVDSADLAQVIEEVKLDGWRARALRWNVAHAPDRVGALFSLTDLLYLGGGSQVDWHAWGMSAMSTLGCLCTRLAAPGVQPALVGRPHMGVLPFATPDFNLRVAVLLRDLQMPVALARSVLEAALYDLFANARPAHIDDWLAIVRDARALSRDQVADYLAAATATNAALAVQQR